MERAITGVKPTGRLHIGNYFGAILPTLQLSEDYQTLIFIADYHALNYIKTAEELKDYSLRLASGYLACGLDPQKIIFFRQSDIPEVFELNWILSNVTPKGLMNRAHAYKAMVEQNEQNSLEKDQNVNMGLYNYPILMSADILLYNTKYVPVGLDQKQHCEIARDIAQIFNNRYGKTFTLPEPKIEEDVAVITGLDGRKMSKSYNNTIELFCDEKDLKKSVNKIITDSKLPGEPKDPDCTLAKIYGLFASKEKTIAYKDKLKDGLGWGDAKKELFEVMNSFLTPMRDKYNYYMQNPLEVEKILQEGAKKARIIAKKMLNKIRKKIGVNELFNN